jgi:hypothetical protein
MLNEWMIPISKKEGAQSADYLTFVAPSLMLTLKVIVY